MNIGNPVEVSMLDLAREVVAACDSGSPLEHVGLPVDDPRRRCPDITRARQLIGWEPVVARADGLARTVDRFRSEVRMPAGAAPR